MLACLPMHSMHVSNAFMRQEATCQFQNQGAQPLIFWMHSKECMMFKKLDRMLAEIRVRYGIENL